MTDVDLNTYENLSLDILHEIFGKILFRITFCVKIRQI